MLFARAVPEYLWAFLLVESLGYTALPAVLALALHNAGILGRLGAETVENMPPAPARALAAAGASTSILRKTPDRGLILSTSSAEAEAAARMAKQSENTSILEKVIPTTSLFKAQHKISKVKRDTADGPWLCYKGLLSTSEDSP